MSDLDVLVVDDEESIRHVLMLLLRKEGYKVRCVENGQEALKELLLRTYDLVLTDVRMPVMDGLSLLDEIKNRNIQTTAIAMSSFGSRELAIDALKRGAYDYFNKPFQKEEVLLTLLKAKERLKLKRENEELRSRATSSGSFQGIIGSSPIMQNIFRTVERVASFSSTVLISGESGTGKELIARAIHNLSDRAQGPWIPINCGAIPEHLLESELFGHTKGAFTDASSDKKGLFLEADGGSIFLDEIAELPHSLQVKLLRVLQEYEVRRIGESRATKINVRVIAASLKDLKERVEDGTFREDLYYRLNVIHIHLPPLRQRREDLGMLIEHFINTQNKRQGTSINGVTDEAMDLMLEYGWPGNIRELQNCIERGVILSTDELIDTSVLPEHIKESNDELKVLFHSEELSIKKMSASLERILIRRALEKTHGNRTNAAKILEISHRALLYKIKDYELTEVGFRTRTASKESKT